MTANQLQYQRNLETERSNLANEAIDTIKALASQKSSDASLLSAQANAKQAEVAERNLTNLAMQAYAAMQNAETNSRNATTAQIRNEWEERSSVWRNVLQTLGFVLPSADAVVGAAGKIVGSVIG